MIGVMVSTTRPAALDPTALGRRLDLARRLAVEAARLAAARLRERPVILELKADESPVTAVDREINALLLERLAEADPETPVVGEEGSRGEAGPGWRWFVDPIDGTADYVAGTGEWVVLLGATFEGRPVLGVAAHPVPPAAPSAAAGGAGPAPRLYFAAEGLGAWVVPFEGGRARPIHVSVTAGLSAARLLVGKSRHREGFAARLEAIPHAALARVGSLGLKAALVADGTADAYPSASLQTSLWDLVAPSVIVQEAGGRISDLAGRPLEFGAGELAWRRGVLISNGRLHDALVALLADYGAANG